MTNLASIVDVVISRETQAPSRQGFGSLAFVSEDAVFQERIKVYSSLSDVQNDALAGDDSVRAATRYFSQTNRPTAFYVIKKGTDLAHVQTLTFDADFVTGNSIASTVNAVPLSAVAFNTDHATTIAALATALQGAAAIASAIVNPSNNRQIIITGAAVNTLVAITGVVVTGGASQPVGTLATTQYPDAVATIVESIVAAQLDNDDWYGLGIYSRAEADILAVAADAEAKFKQFFWASNDSDILTTATDDIGSLMQDLGYDRSTGLYHADADGSANDPFPELAWVGEQYPKDPGSTTWKFKSLNGVAVSSLNNTQITNAQSKNVNVYVSVAQLSITQEGVTASGEYVDVIRGSDFITARIREEVFGVLANSEKVPYTNAGVAMLEGAVDSVLRLSTNRNILAADPAYVITTVPVSQVLTTDKASRFYDGLSFEGTLSGAIHKTRIRGRLIV